MALDKKYPSKKTKKRRKKGMSSARFRSLAVLYMELIL